MSEAVLAPDHLRPDTKFVPPQLLVDLAGVINTHNVGNLTDTPDYVLAKYLGDCLEAYCALVQAVKGGKTAEPVKVVAAEYEPTNL